MPMVAPVTIATLFSSLPIGFRLSRRRPLLVVLALVALETAEHAPHVSETLDRDDDRDRRESDARQDQPDRPKHLPAVHGSSLSLRRTELRRYRIANQRSEHQPRG